jgi:arylamine N-acetyltransferase
MSRSDLLWLYRAHIVNIVTLSDNTRWMVDVSFGGDGPTAPIQLRENAPAIRNLGTQDARLVRDFIPGQTERTPPERRFWIYQHRNSGDQPWHDNYCFTDAVEWLPADFDIINCFTGHSAASFQTTTVLVVKFLRQRDGQTRQDEVFGKRMLVNGLVKENRGGRTEVVRVCETEEERVGVLRESFGLTLTDEEKGAIRGFPTEIRG